MSNILFIDDDYDFLEISSRYFTKEGYHIKTLSNPDKAVQLIKSFQPDCIILDVMMPRLNGYELCRQIRSFSNVPIIFLSGRSSENDKIKGLILGGDDYLIKPYSFRELSVRIKVQLRRYQSQNILHQIRYPPLYLDLKQHKAFYHKEDIQLSNREYDLLLLLVTKANQIVTFEEISNYIWGAFSDNDPKTIMVIASRLRKKMAHYKQLANTIETVWSKGYTFRMKQVSKNERQ